MFCKCDFRTYIYIYIKKKKVNIQHIWLLNTAHNDDVPIFNEILFLTYEKCAYFTTKI